MCKTISVVYNYITTKNKSSYIRKKEFVGEIIKVLHVMILVIRVIHKTKEIISDLKWCLVHVSVNESHFSNEWDFERYNIEMFASVNMHMCTKCCLVFTGCKWFSFSCIMCKIYFVSKKRSGLS